MDDLDSLKIFTKKSEKCIEEAKKVARTTGNQTVDTIHLFLVLLYGPEHDVEDLDNIVSRRAFESLSPTLLWTAIQQIEGDPVAVTETIFRSLRSNPTQVEVVIQHDQSVKEKEKADKSLLPVMARFKRGKRRNSYPTPSASRPTSPTQPTRPWSEHFLDAITRARKHKEKMRDDWVSPYHLTLGAIEDTNIKQLLDELQISSQELSANLLDNQPTKIKDYNDDDFIYLSRYATDMTALARAGKLAEIIGRDEEIRRTIQILTRRTKNSAVLLGEPGVGKTAVVEGLAYRIAKGQVPPQLGGTIYSLDLGSLFAGAAKGEYEKRVKGIVDDVIRSQESGKSIILFIDELHLICVGKSSGGQNSGMDAANLLKPVLARGQFRCIGATTLAEYREHIERDGALERRFAQVLVNEPTVNESVNILRGIREHYENHHGVWIMNNAIDAAVTLAHRYLTARRLPDSAVDLLDEACASARLTKDMQPEAMDVLEKEIADCKRYINSIKRDNHPDERQALADTESRLTKLHNQLESFKFQQSHVSEWWGNISKKRQAIIKQERQLQEFASDGQSTSEVEQDLKRLRGDLHQLEKEGPAPVSELNGFFKKYHFAPTASPDIVTRESIARVVEKATKIPVQRLLSDDKSRLLELGNALSKIVIGQPEAVMAVSNAIQVSRTGLANPNRPIATFIFTGPSGTGKTLLSKALAKELFGQETSMIRIDGSEYSQSHSVSRLIGSPPGYVGYDQGGQLTEYVRKKPYCIVLLDEIEKTCKEFLTLFLQVFDEGRLTDGKGRLVDFRNSVIIMTSNIGAKMISNHSGEITDDIRQDVMEVLKSYNQGRFFPPEFLNRVDEVVLFRTMSDEDMKRILQNHLNELQKREGMSKLILNLSEDAKKWLVKMGISAEYGARPLARCIQKQLLNPLAQQLLNGTITEGSEVQVRLHSSKKGLEITSPNSRESESEVDENLC